MEWFGMESGSWADWFGGIATVAGIYIAINQSKIKLKVDYEYDGLNFKAKITNKSNIDVKLDVAYAHFYSKRIGGKILAQHNNPMIPTKADGTPFILKAKNTESTTFYPWNEPVDHNIEKLYVEYGFMVLGDKIIKNKFREKIER
ncbi:TPA: hypothetical protein ACG0YN_001640 [Enterococcus faecium]|uniref:hypothetical protein n=1 Tax=Enterococcus TaxID=1350 RepID=UPI0018840C7E|nr:MULTISPECIES: hypothetical protein [Enterococcus]MBE9890742.1 hypothetical protein [Enterococcus faecium]MCV3186082.1 hypothetical protein [Enterococcus faecium]MDU3120827.1 hypothetical protein [Acinetobacter baumannii]UQQ77172.1 hypothetical protein LQ060_09950 [Enterococcus faecium]